MATIFQKKQQPLPPPRHIAIIMDGNGRWAQKRGLPRTAGHAAGSETFRRIATRCKNLGVEYLTVYAFSTENWKRSSDEVGAIMSLFEKYLHEAIDEMEADHIRLKILGELGPISPERSSNARMKFPRIIRAFRPTSASTTAGGTRSFTLRGALPPTVRRGAGRRRR